MTIYQHEGEQKDSWFFAHVSYVFFMEKLTNGLFLLQDSVENFIILLNIVNEKLRLAKNCLFSLQYDIRNFIYDIIYENFIFTQEDAIVEIC